MNVAIRMALIALMTLAICSVTVSTAVAAPIPYTWQAEISWHITWTDAPGQEEPFVSEGTVHRTGLGEAEINPRAGLPEHPFAFHEFRAGGWDFPL